jgi:protein-S-isoprenylcysteine O-methyltransferase Ste14
VLVYLPARVLAWAGVSRPAGHSATFVAGLVIAALGAALALWCVFTFAFVGRGTPAPFDPPRLLVERGPYRFLRNPMYAGATLALAGAALVYRSPALLAFCAGFVLVCHAFVLLYEEPALRRRFGAGYTAYCARVRRWGPRRRAAEAETRTARPVPPPR